MHGRNLFNDLEKTPVQMDQGQHTRSLHLLIADKQWTCISTTYTHAFTQWPEDWMVLFLLPNLSERLAVLELQIVFLCNARRAGRI